jgi:hypothetical protein
VSPIAPRSGRSLTVPGHQSPFPFASPSLPLPFANEPFPSLFLLPRRLQTPTTSIKRGPIYRLPDRPNARSLAWRLNLTFHGSLSLSLPRCLVVETLSTRLADFPPTLLLRTRPSASPRHILSKALQPKSNGPRNALPGTRQRAEERDSNAFSARAKGSGCRSSS